MGILELAFIADIVVVVLYALNMIREVMRHEEIGALEAIFLIFLICVGLFIVMSGEFDMSAYGRFWRRNKDWMKILFIILAAIAAGVGIYFASKKGIKIDRVLLGICSAAVMIMAVLLISAYSRISELEGDIYGIGRDIREIENHLENDESLIYEHEMEIWDMSQALKRVGIV